MTEDVSDEEWIDLEQLVSNFEQEMRRAGWVIQNRNEMDLNAAQGVAVRDFPGLSARRNLDYLLFVDGMAVGVGWKSQELLLRREREAREASSARRTLAFPVPYDPLPFIVFHDRLPLVSERSGECFRVTRNTGLTWKTSHQYRFPSPSALSRFLRRERVFQRLGGRAVRWLLQYIAVSIPTWRESSRDDRERAAVLRKYLLLVTVPIAVAFLVWVVIGPASIWAMPVSPHSLGTKDFADVRNTTRQVMTAIILGTAAVGGLIFTGRTYRLSLRGQRSDRFSRAVTQLSSTKNSECIGGIYALEQLMLESHDQHEVIVDVLSHFVRERANGQLSPEVGQGQPEAAQGRYALESACQVALSVLGRRPRRHENNPLDLSGTNLTGARLPRAVMRGVVLKGSNLRGADLEDVDLSYADLTNATFAQASLTGARMTGVVATGTIFSRASMVGVDLTKANLSGADMTSVQLNGATLRDARMLRTRLAEANLSDADLTSAYLRYANLDDAYMTKAVLRDAFLRGAGLRRANLAKADLRGAYLRLANLPAASLSQVNLRGAMLHDTNLCGADLSKANLADADLSGTELKDADLSGATLVPLKYSLEEVIRRSPTKDKTGRINLGDVYPPAGLRPNQLFAAKIDANTVLPSDLRSYLEQKEAGQKD